MFYEFDAVANFRELGGIKTSNGRTIKYGLLYRSGELQKATDADIARLSEQLSIGTVIDFRDKKETQVRPDKEIPGAKYISLPALPPMPMEPMQLIKGDHPLITPQEMFPVVYRLLASTEESFTAYRKFFDILLERGNKPVLWHCRQGKDRTGIGAILLMTALGVSWDDSLAEYLRTNEYMQREYDRKYANHPDPRVREFQTNLMFVRADWLGEYLSIVETKGGLNAFIRNVISLSNSEIDTLRSMYLE